MQNSNDTIGNRTRDLPTCSAVPQPTAPPRAHLISSSEGNLCWFEAATSPSVSLSLLLLTHITERSKDLRRHCPAVSGGKCRVSTAATILHCCQKAVQ